MKEKIKEYAKTININDIGYTNISEIKENIYIKANVPFVNYDNKINLSSYETIISIIISYPHTCEKLENLKPNEVYFSTSSWGKDYHIVLKEKLNNLAEYINNIKKIDYKILVDNHNLDDRYIAYNAGLGFYGKNNLLINEKYGSYIFIGHLLTNLHLESNKKINKQCLNCNKCVEACPTKALLNDKYDYNQCLSYLTQKKELTNCEEKLLNNCIYGCDICMKVCPYNKNISDDYESSFTPNGCEFIDVDNYKNKSNKEFQRTFGHLSGSWRGKKIIERNIEIFKKNENNN